MSPFDLSEYRTVHASRTNLLLHLFAVPLFDLGLIAAIVGAVGGRWGLVGVAAGAMLAALALQGVGHRREQKPPEPFAGLSDFLIRWFREQWLVFPWFVLSGTWWRQWRRAGAGS